MPVGASIWGPIIGGGLGFLGGLVGNRNRSSTMRNYGPLQQQLLDLIRNRLSSSANLGPYTSSGIQDINRTYDTIAASQSNDLTARGLGTSPVAGAVDAARQNARAGSIAGFRNSIPLLQRQLQAQDLGLAGQVFGGTETNSTAGGGPGGGLENLAAMLGYYQSIGAFSRGGRQTPSPGSPGGINSAGIYPRWG